MGKQYVRSKSRFPSARSAWMDVGDKTGVRPNQVMKDHTRTQWVWKKKRTR